VRRGGFERLRVDDTRPGRFRLVGIYQSRRPPPRHLLSYPGSDLTFESMTMLGRCVDCHLRKKERKGFANRHPPPDLLLDLDRRTSKRSHGVDEAWLLESRSIVEASRRTLGKVEKEDLNCRYRIERGKRNRSRERGRVREGRLRGEERVLRKSRVGQRGKRMVGSFPKRVQRLKW